MSISVPLRAEGRFGGSWCVTFCFISFVGFFSPAPLPGSFDAMLCIGLYDFKATCL